MDTRNLWPGKKVLVSPQWIERVSWADSEDIYKIYAESFRGEDHLRRILGEAHTLVSDGWAAAPEPKEKS